MKTNYTKEYIVQKIDGIMTEVKEATRRLNYWEYKLKRLEGV